MRRFSTGLLVGALFAICLLELALRFAPVMSGLRMAPTSVDVPYARYLPNQQFVYSFGWALNNARQGSTNAHGFVNSPDSSRPGGILVIGDSYIESLMLPYESTLQGHLEAKFPHQVTAIAASGNNLADSLKIIEAFVPAIRPTTVVLFVEATDLSQLLAAGGAGHNYFVLHGDTVTVGHSSYTESTYKDWMIKSALVRYVYYNLKLPEWLKAAPASKEGPAEPHLVARNRTTQVLEYYFARLSDLSSTYGFRPIFLLDGTRESIYPNRRSRANLPFTAQRERFLELAARYQHEVIDLHPVFASHWATNRQRLDWLPMDGHWNSIGHALAAKEILNRMPERLHDPTHSADAH